MKSRVVEGDCQACALRRHLQRKPWNKPSQVALFQGK